MDTEQFDSYLERQVERGNLSKHSERAYSSAVHRFAEWFGGAKPTIQDFQDYLLAASVGDVTGTEKTGASLNVEKSAFRKYLYVVGRSEEYDQLKEWFTEHFRVRSSGEPDYLSEDELDAIREAAADDPRAKALVGILSETGIRVGEVIRLDRDDVTFDPTLPQGEEAAAAVRVQRQKRGEEVVDKRPLSEEVAQAVDAYIDAIPDYVGSDAAASDGLFVTDFPGDVTSLAYPSGLDADPAAPAGKTYRASTSGISGWLSDVAERAESDTITPERIHPHLFRHTVGTRLGEAGYSAEQIGAYLGRASAAEEYVHLEDAGVVMEMAGQAP